MIRILCTPHVREVLYGTQHCFDNPCTLAYFSSSTDDLYLELKQLPPDAPSEVEATLFSIKTHQSVYSTRTPLKSLPLRLSYPDTSKAPEIFTVCDTRGWIGDQLAKINPGDMKEFGGRGLEGLILTLAVLAACTPLIWIGARVSGFSVQRTAGGLGAGLGVLGLLGVAGLVQIEGQSIQIGATGAILALYAAAYGFLPAGTMLALWGFWPRKRGR